MICNADRDIVQAGLQYIANVHFLFLGGMTDIHVEHLVKITIINITLPIDAELIGAH